MDKITVELDANQVDTLFRLCGIGLSQGGAASAGALLDIQNILVQSVKVLSDSLNETGEVS